MLINHNFSTVLDYYSSQLTVKSKKVKELKEGEEVLIDSNLINLVLERLEKTVNKIENNELNKQQIRILNFLVGNGKPVYREFNTESSSTHLNPRQDEAIKKAQAANDFHLIIGPPGTGKTMVISEIINHIAVKNQQILITAWTNTAVDNILEKLDLNEEQMLRLGSEISKPNRSLALKEKIKKHPKWPQIVEIDNKINIIILALRKIRNKYKIIRKENEAIITQEDKLYQIKNSFNQHLKELEKSRKKYEPFTLKPPLKMDDKLQEWKKRENEAEQFYHLCTCINDLEEFKKELPDQDSFYKLEDEIRKLKSKKLSKKISTIFQPSKFNQFLDELENKEKSYAEIKNQYNHYWDLHDALKSQVEELYPQRKEDLVQDTIKHQLDLVKLQAELINLEKEIIRLENEAITNKLLSESYDNYISAFREKIDFINIELSSLISKRKMKTEYHDNLLDELESLEYSLEKLKLDKQEIIDEIETEILNKVQVVAATVISSAHKLLDNTLFDFMIMDESSQVASFMALIPLLKCKRFVLVGDDQQLQPITKSGISKQLNLSIFNSLIKMYGDSITFLDTQYRMHHKIADISSELFYKGRLLTSEMVAHKTLECEIFDEPEVLIHPESPITFIDTHDLKFYEEETGKGCINTWEAKLTSYLVENLLSGGLKENEIGVITPYLRHKERIKEFINSVEVDTVYSFQGREKEVIIFSLCKSGMGNLNSFTTRFISQASQLNVALTRARKKLIVVGNSNTLKQSPRLKQLLKLIGPENTVKCREGILDNQLSRL